MLTSGPFNAISNKTFLKRLPAVAYIFEIWYKFYVVETYRSGHNELDSKSSCPQGHVGSNPTASAKNPAEIKCFSGAFYV